jgi:anti-sigma factor RsiW
MDQPELFARRMTLRAGEHLDADMLAAFSEQALSARRRSVVLAHLAECEICRECLATHSALGDLKWKPAIRDVAHPFGLFFDERSAYESRGGNRLRARLPWAAAGQCFTNESAGSSREQMA